MNIWRYTSTTTNTFCRQQEDLWHCYFETPVHCPPVSVSELKDKKRLWIITGNVQHFARGPPQSRNPGVSVGLHPSPLKHPVVATSGEGNPASLLLTYTHTQIQTATEGKTNSSVHLASQNRTLEATVFANIYRNFRFLWNPKIHHLIPKTPPLSYPD